MLDKFHQVVEDRHQYAKDWKARTGGKVIGYLCTYAPEEIMYAAGILPVRILGSREPEDVTRPHIFAMYCPVCRDILAQGLKGRYDYLDGIMISQSCLHMRQAFFSWKLHVPVDYSYYLYHPMKVQSPRAKPYLTAELKEFKSSLEAWRGKTISDQDLDGAIEVYNQNRRLMKQVYELRKSDHPPISGAQAMELALSCVFMDKQDHSQLLQEALDELSQQQDGRDAGVRLMITGSENDDREFLRMVEGLDATVVIDDHCTGSRYFWDEVIPEQDRLAAIAARYVDRVPCPSKDWEQRLRFGHILGLARDWRVQGAILIQDKFCDPHECDIPPLKQFLEDNGIPCYFLELDLTVPVGQFQTRVEAFLETLQVEELF